MIGFQGRCSKSSVSKGFGSCEVSFRKLLRRPFSGLLLSLAQGVLDFASSKSFAAKYVQALLPGKAKNTGMKGYYATYF